MSFFVCAQADLEWVHSRIELLESHCRALAPLETAVPSTPGLPPTLDLNAASKATGKEAKEGKTALQSPFVPLPGFDSFTLPLDTDSLAGPKVSQSQCAVCRSTLTIAALLSRGSDRGPSRSGRGHVSAPAIRERPHASAFVL